MSFRLEKAAFCSFVYERRTVANRAVSILTTEFLRTRKGKVKHVDYQLPNRKLAQNIDQLIGDVALNFGPISFLNVVKDSLQILLDSCFAMLQNNNTLKEIQDASMIVTISIMPCGYYIADLFDKPVVTLTTAAYFCIGHYTGAPSLPSNIPSAASRSTDEMTFLERTQNFINYKLRDIGMDFLVNYYFRELQYAYGMKSKGRFSELFGKTELIILPLDFAYQYAHPIMPNTFFVGPLLAKPPKELPEDIEKFMQSSGEHGVVLVSFGSSVCFMDGVIIKRILTAISRMKQKFIWKMKSTTNLEIPANLKAVKWLPQNDILGHEKTKAFVSHMGLNGAAEAAYHGVPTVAAPFTGERIQNALVFIKRAKMARFIDILNADAETWQHTIEEVINNSSYKEHALMASKRMQSWPKSSAERAGDLVQYALDNGGRLPHLKSNANTLYWFQYYCVDVIALLLALAVLLPLVIFKMLKFLLALLWIHREKSKED
eukprot:gene8290-14250_t